MAKTKLFEAWSFRLQQPAPFDDPKYAGSKSMGFSQYNTSSTAQKSTLHAPTMRALLAYAKLVSATENGQSVDGLGAIGHQGTTYRISEYRSANKTDCVVFNPVTGKFNAAQVEDGTQALKPYSVGAGNGTGSGLLFCLMPVLNEDDEFRQKFQEFVSLLESGWADMDAAFECALTLCDNVYRRIENSKQLGSDGVKISIPTPFPGRSRARSEGGRPLRYSSLQPCRRSSGIPLQLCRQASGGAPGPSHRVPHKGSP